MLGRVAFVAATIGLLLVGAINDALCALPGFCDRACCEHSSEGTQPPVDSAPCCQLPDVQVPHARMDLHLPARVYVAGAPATVLERLVRRDLVERDPQHLRSRPPPSLHLVYLSLLL